MYDDSTIEWPSGSEELFVLGEAWGNACLNPWWRSFESDARHFFLAAHTLVDAACERSQLLDPLVNPIVVNYRHGFELHIKSVIVTTRALSSERASIRLTHDLRELWQLALELLGQHYGDETPDEVANVSPIVEQFMQHDPRGTAFRYPRARDGSFVLEDLTHINLPELCQAMKRLECLFECLTTDLGMKLDYHQESRAEHEY